MLNELYVPKLSIRRLFALAVRLYRTHFRTLFLSASLVSLPINLLLSYLNTMAGNALNGLDAATIQAMNTSDEGIRSFLNSTAYLQMRHYTGLATLASNLFVPLCALTIAYVVKMCLNGHAVSPPEALYRSFQKYPSALLGCLFSFLFISLGSALLVLPGLYLRLALSLFLYGIMLGDRPAFSAMGYSLKLVNKNLLLVLIGYGLCYAASFGIGLGLSRLCGLFLPLFWSNLLARTLVVAADLFTYCTLTLIYLHCDHKFTQQKPFGPMAA